MALIIGLNQLNFAFGLHPHEKHAHFYENLAESLGLLGEAEALCSILFFVNLVALLV